MTRTEKLTLLTKAFQASDSQTARKHLQQVRDSQPPVCIIVDDFGLSDEVAINDDSPVSFRHKGTSYRMPLGLVRGWMQNVGISGRWFVVTPEL
jgi:hypothetical protein